jgi:Ca-activated chloride channel family protein
VDIRLNHLESLHWLWAVAGLAAVIVFGFAAKRRDLGRFADHDLRPRLLPYTSWPRQYLRAGLVVAALVLLVAALIDPRWGVSYRQVQQRGIDLVVVLDVSRSMLAEDARPTRLARAKQYIEALVERLNGDRVALVTFAGTANLKCPLTVDYTAFRLALSTAGPEWAPRGGSLLGDALRLARSAFTDEVLDHKAVIVFSDGEDHGSYPLEAAQTLFDELAVPIYTVGIGDSIDGARIPVARGGVTVWLTHEDEEVWSKMDAAGLRDIALATGGAFVPVGVGTVDMGHVYSDRIEPVAKREFETATVKRHDPQFQWFAGAALALLLIESLIGDRRTARQANSVEQAPS